MKRYKLLNERFEHKAGSLVNQAMSYDYGLARDDANWTGVEHVSVTVDPNGGYPFFTVPLHDLVELYD